MSDTHIPGGNIPWYNDGVTSDTVKDDKIRNLKDALSASRALTQAWKNAYDALKEHYDREFIIWLQMKEQARAERGEDNG